MAQQFLMFLMVACLILLCGWIGMGFKSNVNLVIHRRIGWVLLLALAITIYASLITISMGLPK